MIDEKNKRIYFDHSTRSRFQACKEMARLGGRDGWRPKQTANSLSFGHAIHAGWEAYYDALAGGFHDKTHQWHLFEEGLAKTSNDTPTPTERAQAAFLRDLGYTNAQLPVGLESGERRSVERGLYLLEAYIYRWKNERYENFLINGEPQTEVGFQYFITKWEDYDVIYVGYIDRIMINTLSRRPVIFEGKTTTMALSQFVHQCKPNHQVTGYFPAARKLSPDVTECVWDNIFVSDRKPDLKKGLTDRFWSYGINLEMDFQRQVTTRSATDISEFMIELEEDAQDYCRWITSGKARWPRTAPGACHSYGGCMFRMRCTVNIDPEQEKSFMESFFNVEPWEPWKKIVAQSK